MSLLKSTHTCRGIVVNRFPFSDSSLIVAWITAESGLIKTVAKGALRSNSRQGPVLDLFYLCEIRYRSSLNSELGGLQEVRLEHPFLALRRDWKVILCAQYFSELLISLTEPQAEIGELFHIFEKALRYLESHLPTPHLVARYEKKLLELNGLPSEIPQALERGLATHHHSLPANRAKLLKTI